MAKAKRKLILFDVHAILHRAYHALPDFSSSKGEATGALYGLSAMLIKVINDLKPDYLIASYDLPQPTFRKQVYDAYKAGRPKTDDGLIGQIKRSRDVFAAFQIPVYDAPGFEADDVIGTVAEKLSKDKELQVIIASGDMDTLQLVKDDKVVVFTLKKGINDTVIYNEKAVEERYGFGPELLPDYKGLAGDPSDNIIGVKGIGDKTASILIQNFGPIEKIYQKLKKHPEELEAVGIKKRQIEILREGEEEAIFSKTLATIRRDAPIEFSLPERSWKESFTPAQAEALFGELEFRSLLSRLKTLAPRQSSGEEEGAEAEAGIDPEDLKKTCLALWVINSDLTNPTLEDLFSFTGARTFLEAKQKVFEELKKRNLEKIYQEIELPLMPIIRRAEERGILVDKEELKKLSVDLHGKLSKLEEKIYELADLKFNINSPKQLGDVLFDHLALATKGLKKTATGNRSTRESELIKLKGVHPIIEEILSYRELQKLLSTYIDNLPLLLNSDGRLHTNLNQSGTTTGRMSSTRPNLQNIPTSAGLGTQIRKAFIASPGHVLVASDYSQIELRILAALSGDPELLKIFCEHKDIHSSVAARVFKVSESEVTKEMRRKAKVINFGIIYGMGVNALRVNLGSTREEAQEFYDNYFKSFPKIQAYFENVVKEARQRGYTETYFGRHRYFESLNSRLPQLKAQAERMAMNAPLQGTAADLVKMAMIKADERLKKEKLDQDAHLILQVHDELIYEVKKECLEQTGEIVKEAMEKVADFPVPLEVGLSAGPSWGELEKLV